jgi:DNA gyrase subunit B
VTRKKKVEYVKNEGAMRKALAELGGEGTSLVIRDKKGGEKTRLKNAELRKVMGLLEQLEDYAAIAERRGLRLQQLLKLRAENDQLPTHRVILDGKETFFYEEEMYEAFAEKHKLEELESIIHAVDADENGNGNGNGNGHAQNGNGAKGGKTFTKAELLEKKAQARRRLEKNEELHENKKIEELIGQLAEMDLPIEDYYLRIEETDSGEKIRTRYAVENGDDYKVDVAGLCDIVGEIHKIAKHGIEVGRFKGLGEMNAEELWITTMDPQRRTLLRVTLEGASNAEAMFSTLMGEDVERRRQFIEAHALEVRNLDV